MQQSLSLDHVELLVALQSTGNLARAATTLSISPSAASHRLREAERRVGVALTEPAGRSIRLTVAAEHLADVGGSARAALRGAEETARWLASADRAAVRIALDGYDTAPWCGPLVDRPDLPADLDFVRVPFAGAPDAVFDGRVDLGVVPVPADDPVGDVVAHDRLVGVVRRDHPAAGRGVLEPGDVAIVTYSTMGDRPARGFEHERFFEPAGARPLRLRKVESLAMILRLLRRYGTITVQPELALADAWLEGLAVVPLAGGEIAIRWEAVTRRDAGDDVTGTIAAIRRLLAERAPSSHG